MRGKTCCRSKVKFVATFVGTIALLACGTGMWLAFKTLRYALGADYELFHGVGDSGNGLGIFAPALLLLIAAWCLARFAKRLWTA